MDDYKEAQEFPELLALFGFNYEHTLPQYFASFDQRLLASVIDYFMLTMVYILMMIICFIFMDDKVQRIAMGIGGLPLIPVLKFFYGAFAESSVKQGTAGKRLLNIKVTDLEGRPITLRTAFGRNAAKVISTLPFFFGYLYSFLNKKQQCWHDVICNTLVIKDRLI